MDKQFRERYGDIVKEAWAGVSDEALQKTAGVLWGAWQERRQVFVCGNGGSAANAMHWANDLFYGVSTKQTGGLRVAALSANPSVLTCLANDVAYAEIFSQQLAVQAQAGDVLIVLSGSGNSPNVVKAVETARSLGLRTVAVLGFDGGQCRTLAEIAVHFPVRDMQVAEDCQLMLGHMLTRWLKERATAAKKQEAAV